MLNEPPKLVIKRDWPRIDAATLARLDGAQTGHLVDAMSGRGGLDRAIKPVIAGKTTCLGTAVPVTTGANDNLALIAAAARAQPNDVLVVAADAFEGTAVCGDIVAGLARNAGCAAIVIDGMARDLTGLEEVSLPIFARGITPNSCVKSGPGKVGLPVVVAGVTIGAGDLVMGDRDGVVVVPQARIGEVIDAVDAIRKAEAEVIAKVEAGMTTLPFMAELLASDAVEFVE